MHPYLSLVGFLFVIGDSQKSAANRAPKKVRVVTEGCHDDESTPGSSRSVSLGYLLITATSLQTVNVLEIAKYCN
jgi:hypothetical protein